MLLDRFSLNVTPRIFFVTATPPVITRYVVELGDISLANSLASTRIRYRKLKRGTTGDGMVKKIAVEEHCLCPGFEDYWAPTVADLPANKRETFLARLTDFGEMRLAAMELAGIERCVLSIAGPGVQAERDTKTARDKGRSANDFLAREIAKRPQRYSGFAHLPMQDAVAAAD